MCHHTQADTWLVANPQRVLAALHFRELQGGGAGPAGVKVGNWGWRT